MSKNQKKLEYLHSIVGDYTFNMICIAMSGERLNFPKRTDHINIEDRNRQIKLDYWKGISPYEIATQYNLSVSQIYKIIEDQH